MVEVKRRNAKAGLVFSSGLITMIGIGVEVINCFILCTPYQATADDQHATIHPPQTPALQRSKHSCEHAYHALKAHLNPLDDVLLISRRSSYRGDSPRDLVLVPASAVCDMSYQHAPFVDP